MRKSRISLIFGLIFFFVVIQFVRADIISDCSATPITTPGYYELNQSITSANTCLTIAASDVEIDCKGHTIEYANTGTATRFGIDVVLGTVFLNNITIRNCYINKPSALNTAGYGIRMQRTSNSFIINNTIQTNGTTNNYGIYLFTACENNLIENNTINASGNTIGSVGVYLSTQSNNNTLRNNIISGRGTATSHSVYIYASDNNLLENNSLLGYSSYLDNTDSDIYNVFLSTGSKYNVIRNNSLFIQASEDNYNVYIYYNSNYNLVYNNTMQVNGTATGTGNYGVYILGSDYNKISNNSVYTYGYGTMYGMRLGAASLNNVLNNNFISTYGTSANNYGIYIVSALFNNITENTIFTNGLSTGNHGISLSSSQRNYIYKNNISTNGTTTAYGIYLTGSDYVTISNNFISTNGIATSTVTGNNGIHLSSSTNNNVINNVIVTNGTTSGTPSTGNGNIGINLYVSSGYNYVHNNTIQTNGRAHNYGMYLYVSNKNTIIGNKISTSGELTMNHGMFLSTSSNVNSLLYNDISTYGSTTNHGISLTTNSDGNEIIGNNIITNGSITGAVTTNNFGITLTTSCYNNLFENNTVQTGGGNYNYGFYSLLNSNSFILRGNNLSTGGNRYNYGVFISESRLSTIDNNIITTSGIQGNNYGMYLYSNSKYNLIKKNNLTTSGSTNSYGIFIDAIAPNFPNNNFFEENNFISISGTEFRFADAEIDEISLISQSINSYLFTGIGSIIIVRNESAGEIKFLERLTGSGNGFSDSIKISENYALINTGVAGFNKPAEITLYNLSTSITTLQIYKNGVLCNDCVNLTPMQAGNVTFNVTGGGIYSINASDEIPHVITLLSPENNTNITTQNYSFNFTVTDEISSIFQCYIHIDNEIYGSNESVLNAIETSINVSGISGGSHEWYVSCLDEANWSQNSETRTINNNIPYIIYNSPENDSFINNASSVLLNISLSDTEESIFELWIYGDGELINYSVGISTGEFTYLWEDLNLGQHNWSVIINDGFSNSTDQTYYFNIINLTINCEAGGPYQSGALVLAQGNVSDGTSPLSSQIINASVYLNGILNTSNNLNSTSEGSFSTIFLGLATGNYTLNVSVNYQGLNAYCLDYFSINEGYDAGFISGNESGYILGFNEGNITGFNLGNTTGFVFGNSSGFTLGNVTGFILGNTTGFILGNTTGYVLGNATGFKLGNTTGFILGNSTGFITGNLSGYILGFDTGNLTGFNLGNYTGYLLGNLTGFNLGNETGFYYGNTSGYSLGYTAGNESGYTTGYAAGLTAVGNTSASLILDKIISFSSFTNQTFVYNVTLRLTNKGGSNATYVNITDLDSLSSPYFIGNITPGETVVRNYLLSFARNSTTYHNITKIAQVSGIDSFLSSLIYSNSSQIVLTIPGQETGQKLTLIKNVYYNSENSTNVNYTITVEVVNSGGIDLKNINILDSDLNLNTLISLNRTQNYSYSNFVLVDKAASNTNKLFVKSTALANSITYESNQMQVRIPGYGGPADTIVNSPSYVNQSEDFNTTIQITNQNPDIGQNFIIYYWITNEFENVNYSSGTRTIYVGASQTNNTIVTFSAPSDIGIYKFKSVTTYEGGVDLAEDSFQVVAPGIVINPSSGKGSSKCNYIWECSSWSICSSEGLQTRICTNKGTCKGTVGKPIEQRNCSEVSFNVKLRLNQLNLTENETLEFNITITQKKPQEEINVQVNYLVLDADENEIFNEITNYSVKDTMTYKEILNDLKLVPGEYTLKIYTIYNGEKKAEDEQRFIVREYEQGEIHSRLYIQLKNRLSLFNYIVLLGIILILVLLIVIVIKIKLRRRDEIDVLIKEGKKYFYEGKFDEAIDIYPVLKNLYKSKYKGDASAYEKINSYSKFLSKGVKDKLKKD